MEKNFITHYLRIGLGIVVFSIGIIFLCYETDDSLWKWYTYIFYFIDMIFFLGFGLYLLDVNYN